MSFFVGDIRKALFIGIIKIHFAYMQLLAPKTMVPLTIRVTKREEWKEMMPARRQAWKNNRELRQERVREGRWNKERQRLLSMYKTPPSDYGTYKRF